MRPLEIILVLSIAILSLLTLALRRSSLPRWAYAIPAIVAIIHAIPFVEGVRWQMVPAYIMAVFLLVLAGQPGAYFRRGVAGVTLVGAVVSLILGLILPIPILPAPTGPYTVGTTIMYIHEDRPEIYTDDPNDQRTIAIQIWYPMDESDAGNDDTPVIIDADKYSAAFGAEFGVPAFVMSHIGLMQSHSVLQWNPNSAMQPDLFIQGTTETFPVVVGSHGWRGFRALHTTQFEALASHGYIAVGIDHPYGALATIGEDGRAVPLNPNALPEDAPDDEYDRASAILEDVYEADIKATLDALERLNVEGPFAGRLDLDRIGIFGHSTGGGAMVQTCQTDSRCKAGLGMDAWIEPIPADQLAQGVMQPFMFMRSEPWTKNNNDALLTRLYDASSVEKYRLGIMGTLHRDYTIAGLLSPLLPSIGLAGKLDPIRTLDIVDAYMLAFFDKTLKGESSPLLDGTSAPYTEVRFQ